MVFYADVLEIWVNSIQNGPFWGCSRIGGEGKMVPPPKICHSYLTMMKLGAVVPCLKKIIKYIYI